MSAGVVGGMALDAHRLVVETLHQQVEGRSSDGALTTARIRFDAAVIALDAHPDVDAGTRAELALAIAGLGVSLFGAAPGLVDIEGLSGSPRSRCATRSRHRSGTRGWAS